jgi:hypothetical protein
MTAKKRGARQRFNDVVLYEGVAMCELAQGADPNHEEAYRRATAGLSADQQAKAIARLRKARGEIEAAKADILQRRMPAARKALAEGRLDDALATGCVFMVPGADALAAGCVLMGSGADPLVGGFALVPGSGFVGVGPVAPALLGPTPAPELPLLKTLTGLAGQATPAELAEVLRNIAADLEGGRLAASDVVRDALGKLVGAARDGLGKKPI